MPVTKFWNSYDYLHNTNHLPTKKPKKQYISEYASWSNLPTDDDMHLQQQSVPEHLCYFWLKVYWRRWGGQSERHKKWRHTKQGSVRLPSTLHECWIAPVPASPGFIPCTMNDECIIWRGRHIKTATIWTKVFLALGFLTCCMSNHVALFMTEVLIRSWHVRLTATQTLRESSTWLDTDMTTFNVWVWIFPYCLFINM